MKKFITYSVLTIVVALAAYFMFIYFVTFSEGYRAGELVKISKRGMIFKTWEGRLSQGISEEQQFNFSVEKSNKKLIEKLKELQGKRVKLTYIERFGTFFWLGDTKYYLKEVVEVRDSEAIDNTNTE
ncbi:MAG: 6-phosphogluconate dehydrogenase [Flavobacteriaceae bacterium]|nr:6-phosphogluconate dehydrogenase [Flavobacteriaceae bacterium]